MAQVHVAKNVMLSGSTLVGSHHVRDGHLSEPRRTQRAVERALQDDLKPWVALDPTQTASLLCFSREDSEAFIGAVGQVGKEMGTLARQEEMWQWLKRKSGAGNISGGVANCRPWRKRDSGCGSAMTPPIGELPSSNLERRYPPC